MAKVLVVDDQPVNRDLLETLLRYHGHDSLLAGDGAQALAVAEADRPDLVIADLIMPVMDGVELVQELRRRPGLATTPVIFCTAVYMRQEVAPLATSLGVRQILAKPIDPAELIAAVRAALNDAEAEQAAASAAAAAAPPGFHQEYLRTISNKLAAKVAEFQAAEAALKESEARFRSLAEFSPVGMFALDNDHGTAYVNRRMREIFGLDDAPTGGSSWLGALDQEDRDRVAESIRPAITRRRPFRERVKIARPDGELRWADVQAAPIKDGGNGEYVGTVDDVTEEVTARLQHEELDARVRVTERLESLGQLAGGIAHDFNNLLAVMLNYTQFVAEGLDGLDHPADGAAVEQMRADLAAIADAGTRAADLTHQLLIFGRREVINREVLDANELVRDSQRLLARTIGEHARLDTQLAPSLPPVKVDRRQVEQVIVNLVVNARDAVGAGGHIWISTDDAEVDKQAASLNPASKPGRYARITVTDDGAGMTREVMARAFDPFFTTKGTGKGTGLGLATVHGIVSQLGGHVTLYSKPGHGTSVSVYLPATDEHSQQPSHPAAGAAPAGHGEVVLVVEDDDRLRAVTVRTLKRNGYRVLAADGGHAALEFVRDATAQIDLLLTDVVMPEMSGPEVAERAVESRPTLPVLFMTGYAFGAFGPANAVNGAIEIVEKPFTARTLLSLVARVLSRARADPHSQPSRAGQPSRVNEPPGQP